MADKSIPQKKCFIYCMQFGSPARYFKIGSAVDVDERMSTLQTGCPEIIICVGAFSGDHKLERRIHHAFAPFRYRGEWFMAVPQIISYIGRCTKAESEGRPIPEPPRYVKASNTNDDEGSVDLAKPERGGRARRGSIWFSQGHMYARVTWTVDGKRHDRKRKARSRAHAYELIEILLREIGSQEL